jgi:hypothetical protein
MSVNEKPTYLTMSQITLHPPDSTFITRRFSALNWRASVETLLYAY